MSQRHPCPGRCGRDVPNNLFACRGCWRRLPRQLQRDITRSWTGHASKSHAEAMLAAGEWYAANTARPR